MMPPLVLTWQSEPGEAHFTCPGCAEPLPTETRPGIAECPHCLRPLTLTIIECPVHHARILEPVEIERLVRAEEFIDPADRPNIDPADLARGIVSPLATAATTPLPAPTRREKIIAKLMRLAALPTARAG